MTENIKADAKDKIKHIYNPVSLGTLYFGFALSLWASEQISNHQVLAIAILCTIISFAFFVAVYSERVLKLTNKVLKILASLTFVTFIYGFTFGWIQTFSQVSGIILEGIIYFGFAWIVTFLLTMIKDINSKPARIFASIIVLTILLVVAGLRLYNHDYMGGGILIAIAVLIMLVAIGWLKVHGGIFE